MSWLGEAPLLPVHLCWVWTTGCRRPETRPHGPFQARVSSVLGACSVTLCSDKACEPVAGTAVKTGRAASLQQVPPKGRAAVLHADAELRLGRHHKSITASLKDVDISIRRRALDLLFTMCTKSSAPDICSELLKYLEIADFSLRDELVLKLAILAERCVPSAWGNLLPCCVLHREPPRATPMAWQT